MGFFDAYKTWHRLRGHDLKSRHVGIFSDEVTHCHTCGDSWRTLVWGHTTYYPANAPRDSMPLRRDPD